MKAGIGILLATGLLIFAAYKLSPVAKEKNGATQASSDQTRTAQSSASVSASKMETASAETAPSAAEPDGSRPSMTNTSDSQVTTPQNPEPDSSASSDSASSHWYGDPPHVNADISVEQAYAAIPHRRTVWNKDGTTVPTSERDYLAAMFQVLDQAVVVQVAGIRSYQRKDFDGFEAEAELGLLIDYVQNTQAPPGLHDYNGYIIAALSGERQFFRDWKEEADRFNYSEQVMSHQGLTQADVALHQAYQELMTKYPHESRSNQDAFYDYHCGADFR